MEENEKSDLEKEWDKIRNTNSNKKLIDAKIEEAIHNIQRKNFKIEEPIKLVDLCKQSILHQEIGKLILTNNYIELELKFSAEEIDVNEELSIKTKTDRNRYGYDKYFKKFISGLSILLTDDEKYRLTIAISGSTDLMIYFDDEIECKRIKDIIDKWLFN